MTHRMMPDRRTAVKGLAVAALMAGPAAASTHPDAELLGLREPLERLAAQEREASTAMVQAHDALSVLEHESRPASLGVRPDDARVVLDKIAHLGRTPVAERDWFGEWCVGQVRVVLAGHRAALANGRPSRLSPASVERMEEIVAASDEWTARLAASAEQRAVDAAEAGQHRIAADLNVLIDRALSLRATTMEGLQVKAIAAAACSSETVEAWIADPRELSHGAGPELASVLRDIMSASARS